MEVFKDLVKFNRYKSVESFNNAKDITSSTISIVKLDENVMDIYLGRTKISDSNLLKANIELKKLIDSFDVKLKEIESDVVKSKKRVDNIDVNQNSQSQSIFDIKNEIKSLHSEDNHILEILGEISKKLSKLKDIDTIPSFSDIVIIKQNIESVSKELLDKIRNNISKINTLEVKDNKFTNDINELKKEILALNSEDIHIWDVLNGLKSVSETIMSDIKENNENINNEILTLKEKIKHLTGVNVDNFVTLEEADRRLDKAEKRLNNLEKSDESFQTKVDEIDDDVNSIKENVKKLQSFESKTNENIKSIVNEIREVYATKEYVDGKVDSKFDAAGTAAGLNAVMDERVTALEKINHNDYVTEEKLASKGYLTSDIADKKYAPIGTTGSGESIDLNDYATIEYVKETYAKKSDIPKLEWLIFD